jgi:hypothetical protein
MTAIRSLGYYPQKIYKVTEWGITCRRYTYIYICTYIHVYIHTHLRRYEVTGWDITCRRHITHMYMCVCVCVYMYIYTHLERPWLVAARESCYKKSKPDLWICLVSCLAMWSLLSNTVPSQCYLPYCDVAGRPSLAQSQTDGGVMLLTLQNY